MMGSGACNAILCISLASAPISPGVTEVPVATNDDPNGADEVSEEPTSVLPLALDMLKGEKRQV